MVDSRTQRPAGRDRGASTPREQRVEIVSSSATCNRNGGMMVTLDHVVVSKAESGVDVVVHRRRREVLGQP